MYSVNYKLQVYPDTDDEDSADETDHEKVE